MCGFLLALGPTSDVWIGPWADHLRSLGVDFRFGTRVLGIRCSGGLITSVHARGPDGRTGSLRADWYVAAVPVEHMAQLATPAITKADPGLANLGKLHTRWMNGIVFFLLNDVPVVHGHVIYIDSAWSLTSISQRQFWAGSPRQVRRRRRRGNLVGRRVRLDNSGPDHRQARHGMQP